MPKIDHRMATNTRACGTSPTIGRWVTNEESPQRIGRNAIRVITESMRLTPRPSMMPANRMVSSWTRWEAPSMWRTRSQSDM